MWPCRRKKETTLKFGDSKDLNMNLCSVSDIGHTALTLGTQISGKWKWLRLPLSATLSGYNEKMFTKHLAH